MATDYCETVANFRFKGQDHILPMSVLYIIWLVAEKNVYYCKHMGLLYKAVTHEVLTFYDSQYDLQAYEPQVGQYIHSNDYNSAALPCYRRRQAIIASYIIQLLMYCNCNEIRLVLINYIDYLQC